MIKKMKTPNPDTCFKRVYGSGGWSGHQCTRSIKLREPDPHDSDGTIVGWCVQHAPSTVKARTEKRNAKWEIQRKGQRRLWRIDEARDEICDAAIEEYKIKNEHVHFEVTDEHRRKAEEAVDTAIEAYLKL